jgi:hypothetical protein
MGEQELAQKEPREISGEEFLRLIQEHGVHVHISGAGLKNPDSRELVARLATMRMTGVIPHFTAEIVL